MNNLEIVYDNFVRQRQHQTKIEQNSRLVLPIENISPSFRCSAVYRATRFVVSLLSMFLVFFQSGSACDKT